MKKIKLLIVLLLTISLNSCNSDDDFPQTQLPTFNVFCFGDGTQGFDVISSFRGETTLIAPDQIRTQVTILGDGLSLNDMDEIEGNGPLIQLDFYGNNTAGFQTGLYQISTLQESANVIPRYSLDFDPTATINASIPLEDGFIRVSPFENENGFFIEIAAIDANGDEFHGNYLGLVSLIP